MTHFIDDLMRALTQHNIEVISFQKVTPQQVERFDCIILSGGGSAGEVSESKEIYKNEIKIIHESDIPIFGICEGFQVIGAAYDSEFKLLKNFRKGLNKIHIVNSDPIFHSLKTVELRAFEYHHIAIEHLGKELIPLGVSSDGIEIIRHKSKLIYASQFHPEELQDGNDGHTILKNFISML